MSKGQRLRAGRDRDELLRRRTGTRASYWARQLERLKRVYDALDKPVPSDTASLTPAEAADEHSKLSQELDRRPCGGTTYCVTRNGTRASHTHVGCRGG